MRIILGPKNFQGIDMSVSIKRVYSGYSEDDGTRILVDRLWPRGIKKEDLKIDYWLRDIAPSTELRKWFDHTVDKWSEFERRYRLELESNPTAPRLLELAKGDITLVYGAKDELHNNAVVIKSFVDSQLN